MNRRPDLSPRVTRLLLLLIVCLGAGLRSPQFFAPFGPDETGQRSAFHALLARQLIERGTLISSNSAGQLFAAGLHDSLTQDPSHAPTAIWAVAGSLLSFGDSEWAARLPFLLASTLALLYAYRLGLRIDGRTGGIAAALCLATLPAAVLFGAEITPSGSLLLLSSLGLTDAYFAWRERRTRSNTCLVIAWLIAAVASDWSGAFIGGALLGHYLLGHSGQKTSTVVRTGIGILVVAAATVWATATEWDSPLSGAEAPRVSSEPAETNQPIELGSRSSPTLFRGLLRFVSAQLSLFGITLLVGVAGWFLLAIRARGRRQAIPICLWIFAGACYLAEASGGFRGSDGFHPVAGAYVAAVVAALAFLRLSPGPTLWLAMLLGVANLAAASAYANGNFTGPDSPIGPNTDWQLARFVSVIPQEDNVLLDDRTDAATALYYLDRSICVVRHDPAQPGVAPGSADFPVRARRTIVRRRGTLPGADRERDLQDAPEAEPSWLLTKRDLDRPLRSEPVQCVGDWRLYRLALGDSHSASTNDDRSDRGEAVLSSSPEAAIEDVATSAILSDAVFPDRDLPSSAVNSGEWPRDVARPFRLTCDWTVKALQQFWVIVVLICLVALRDTRTGFCTSIRKRLQPCFRQPWTGPAICGLSAVMAAGALAALTSLPVPAVHDEFAYLLAGETYSLGRATNPTHPFWRHFESLHVFHEPTYQAKYPPAQGIFLATGFLLGHPIAGVWLSLGLACGAVCWALQTSLPRRWSLLGGMLCAGNPWILQRWGSTYWGGAVAMLGGALLVGGVLRLARRPGLNGAIPAAIGLALLANSRPFEGLVLTVALASWLGLRILRTPCRDVAVWCIPATVIGSVMILTLVGMLAYNRAVTGDCLRMPYVHHEEMYAVAPSFLWQAERPAPEYRHETLRSVHLGWECQPYHSARRDLYSFVRWWFWKMQLLWAFLVGTVLGVALVALPATLGNPLSRLAAASLGLLLGVMSFHTYMQAHYAAPATVLVVLLLVQSLRALRTFRWADRSSGRTLARCLVLIQLFALIPFCLCYRLDFERFASADALRQRFEEQATRRDFDYLTASATSRVRLDSLLRSRAQKSLVLVRCGPRHDHLVDWVYNAPDIDGAHVVWARALDRAANARLREYFADREIWLLVVDGGLPQLFRFADSPPADGSDRLAPVSWLSD